MKATPFSIAARNAKDNDHRELAARITIEGRVVRRTIQALLQAGYTIDLNDGGETTVFCSRSLDELMQAAFSTDEDYLIARDKETGKKVGMVFLVYGNDGHDVVSDYSLSLEDVMKPVNDYADGYCFA